MLEGMTFGQFFAVWLRPPQKQVISDCSAINAHIAKRRAELGMPPMKPSKG